MSVLEIADIFGIVAFALSGFFVGVRERLDLLGIFLASFLTALGGGITRDAIADKMPYAFTDILPTILVVCVVVLAIIFKLHKFDKFEKSTIFIVSDTFGLVSFAITGAIVGIGAGFNIFGIVILGLLTAVGGSAIRDVMINRVPFFMISEFYGTVAIIIALIIYVLNLYDMVNLFNIILVFVFGVALRLFGYYKGWKLPNIT